MDYEFTISRFFRLPDYHTSSLLLQQSLSIFKKFMFSPVYEYNSTDLKMFHRHFVCCEYSDFNQISEAFQHFLEYLFLYNTIANPSEWTSWKNCSI